MTGVTHAGSTAELIAEHGGRRSVPAGGTVFREGDAGGPVYAVVTGEVKLTVATSAGRDVLIGVKRPGDAFGELAALDGRARSATATATQPTVLSVVDAGMFLELLERQPAAAIETLRLLAAYLRAANQRVSAHAGDDTVARCARQLLDLADRHAEHRARGRVVALAISQDDLQRGSAPRASRPHAPWRSSALRAASPRRVAGSRSRTQRHCSCSRPDGYPAVRSSPNAAPRSSITTAKRPPGKSIGPAATVPPSSATLRADASTSSVPK